MYSNGNCWKNPDNNSLKTTGCEHCVSAMSKDTFFGRAGIKYCKSFIFSVPLYIANLAFLT